MKIKVSEATGPVLDWMAAKALGYTALYKNCPAGMLVQPDGLLSHMCEIRFSSDWYQGGPIIERERIMLIPEPGPAGMAWTGCIGDTDAGGKAIYAHTPLIAAMRCYVASKLGDIVDVPEELTK